MAPWTLHKAHIQHNNRLGLKKQTSESTISQKSKMEMAKPSCVRSQWWRSPNTSTADWNWWSRWRRTDALPNNIVFRHCHHGKQQQSTVSQGVVTSRFEKVFRFRFYFNYRYAQRLRKVQADYRLSSLVLNMIPNDESSSKSGESTDNVQSVSLPSNQTNDPVLYSFRLVHRLGGQRPDTWWSNV